MSLIICKKCGGPHVTIKCGKVSKPIEEKVQEPLPQKTFVKKPYANNKQESFGSYSDKRKIVTVKISNLPEDMTVLELEKLVQPWGHIGRVNLNNFENKSGFIDFNFKNEADYFIEALDRTPFEHMIIRVEYIENKY